jgi:hypothetical protein
MRNTYWKTSAFLALIPVLLFARSVRAADPGLPLPNDSGLNDQKPGSVLFYNLVTSSPSGSTSQNREPGKSGFSAASRLASSRTRS